ncbi:EAL domain-containing protein [Xanthomonas theicola]|uniref:EAL domain-containing protein n=1 Tax=Xanthomonas theicola TaxID=56464 RepID=A0A2S6ZMA1_9XANT|nr:EAL domain-containing protein [Xanthomonas theicola]PPT93336.1 hypothetical protein XthCFBP4691_00220 [Xanthomonas theicola]QNH25525.1 EAL domain-containing protein [Xanthomonas theicola]
MLNDLHAAPMPRWRHARMERPAAPAQADAALVDADGPCVGQDIAALHLRYQPIYRTDGGLHSIEALLREKEPRRGACFPRALVAGLRSQRRLAELDCHVLDQASKALCLLEQAHGQPMPLSVNVAMESLDDDGFLRELERAQNRLSGQLTLELLETSAGRPSRSLKQRMQALRGNGLRLSLDDYGTGHSSLLRLLDFATFSEIKLSSELTHDCANDPMRMTLIRHSYQLARELALDFVLEGIESADALRMLATLDMTRATAIQGHALCRPVPYAQLRVLSRHGHLHHCWHAIN